MIEIMECVCECQSFHLIREQGKDWEYICNNCGKRSYI